MNPTYDKNYFIKKFEAIPEDRWTTDDYMDDAGRCCAFGHCGVRHLKPTPYSEEADSLASLLQHCTAAINDGQDDRYKQPTPKQRILAALRDV